MVSVLGQYNAQRNLWSDKACEFWRIFVVGEPGDKLHGYGVWAQVAGPGLHVKGEEWEDALI